VLKLKDFDFTNGTFQISRAFSEEQERPRKNKKPYYLPFNQGFVERYKYIFKDKLPEAYLFTNTKGRHYTRTGLKKVWSRVCKKMNITISLYSATRHSIASQAINKGIDIGTVSQALGHSSLDVTKKYASLEVKKLKVVVD
jgi:site-specific recombinase XerD